MTTCARARRDEIRTAYKRESLKTHPDRVQGDAAARRKATENFQRVADACAPRSSSAKAALSRTQTMC